MKTPRTGNKAEGARLRLVRLEHKQTVTEAAARAGLAASTMQAMESGSLRVSDSSLVKLSELWGVSFEKLMRRIRG